MGNEWYSRGMSVQSAEVRSSYYDYHRANWRSLRCFKNYGEVYHTVTYITDEWEYISSESVLSGDVVKHAPFPEKSGYNFTWWNISWTDSMFNLNTPVVWNLVLKAVYEKKKFVVTRKYESGDVIDTTEVWYWDKPVHLDLDDIVEDKYTYVFIGWSPDINTVITGNMDFIAVFEPIVNKYDITRVNEDWTVLQSSRVEYGEIPIYSWSVPTKSSTLYYDYIFNWDWLPKIKAVTWNMKYIAQFNEVRRSNYSWAWRRKSIDNYKEIHWVANEDSEIRFHSNPEVGQVIAIDWWTQKTVAIKNTEIVATVRNTVHSSNPKFTKEENEAYSFAKSNEITTIESIEQAKMNTEVTRIQMAKMLSNFAINVLWQEPDTEKWVVKFDDVTNKMDKQYDNAVTKAYQLGIMWQNVKNDKFRPNDEVTRAEFASALSRLLFKTPEWKYKWTSKYYVPHIAKLYNEWIINKVDEKIKEKRWYVMIMLKRTVE